MSLKSRLFTVAVVVVLAALGVYSAGHVLAAPPPADIKVELRCSNGDDAGTFMLDLTLTTYTAERAPVLIQVSAKGTHVLDQQLDKVGRIKVNFPAPTSEGVHIMKVVRQKDGTVDADADGEMALTAAVDVNAESCGTAAGTRLFVGNLSMNSSE